MTTLASPDVLKLKNDIDSLSLGTILSGLVLLLLLPIGTFWGFSFWIYSIVFVIHAFIQLTAVAWSIGNFLKKIKEESQGYLLYSAIFLFFFGLIFSQTILPITAKDALIHHLALPKIWLSQGGIVEVPWHEWSYYPQLIQLGYTGLLSLGLGQLSAVYHFTYLILAAYLGLLFVEKHLGSRGLGIWAFLLTISLPLAIRLGGEPLVDLPLTLFFGVAFALIVEACEAGFAGQRVLGAGVALGLALGTKYNPIPATLFFILALLFYCSRCKISFGATARLTLVLTLVAAAVFSPWLVRNYLYVGNPIYPFLQGSQGGGLKVIASISPLEQRHWLYGENVWDIVLVPFRMITHGADEDPSRFDGVLSPVLLLALIGIFCIRKHPWLLWAGLWTVGYLLFSILTASARVRYLSPVWLPMLGLTMAGFWQIEKSGALWRKWLSSFLAFSHIIFAVYYGMGLQARLDFWNFVRGDRSADNYLAQNLQEYPLIKYINDNLASDVTTNVYLLGTGNRFFYFNVRVIGGHFSENLLIETIIQSSSVKDIENWFSDERINYLLVHRERVNAILGAKLTPVQAEQWQKFIGEKLQEVYSAQGYSLLKVGK